MTFTSLRILFTYIVIVCFFKVIIIINSQSIPQLNHELLESAKHGKVDEIIKCLNNGADIEIRDNYGVTSLVFSSNNGHLLAVQTLVERKANIEARSNNGRMALHWSSLWGHIEVTKFLIEKGSNIDEIDIGK